MNKIFKMTLKVIPVVLIGIILITSSFIFEANRKQTYERIRSLKETQVQVIASQVDSIVRTTGQPFSLDTDNVYGLQRMIESINEQAGVYCYLFDKEDNQITGYSKQQKHIIGESIVNALRANRFFVISTHEYYGYLSVETELKEKFLVYWQGIPSGDKQGCEYYIVLTVSEKDVQDNEAINSCKVMIGILSIILIFSLYGNLYINPVLNEKRKEE